MSEEVWAEIYRLKGMVRRQDTTIQALTEQLRRALERIAALEAESEPEAEREQVMAV